MNAVIYARYSCSSQSEQSIEGQLRDCYTYAEREKLNIVGEYIDRALTGKYDDRPEFQRMIDDAKSKEFNYIIVWKLDRFARNRYDSAFYKHKLKQNDVRVLSAMENIGDGDESIILEAVLEASAEYFSRDLRKKVKRGMRETALKGLWTGGTIPLGLKVVDRRFEIDEEKAFAPRYANTEYANGAPDTEIMEYLNSHGYKTAHGRPFTLSSLKTIIGNPKYFGIYKYDDITLYDIIPPLLDQSIYERVLVRKNKGRRAPGAGKAKVNYRLQGKAFCGKCGSSMVGECGRGRHGKMFYYYACYSKKRKHSCDKVNEKKDFLEWYVVEQTLDYVLEPSRTCYIADRIVEKYNEEFNDGKVQEMERRLMKIESDLSKSTDILLETDSKTVRERITQKIDELEVQRQDVSLDLSKLRIANGIRFSKEEIVLWLKSFCGGDITDEAFRRQILDVFINAIYVYDDKVIIYYNLKGGKQVSYIDMVETSQEADCTAINSKNPSPSKGVRISKALVCQKGFEPPTF